MPSACHEIRNAVETLPKPPPNGLASRKSKSCGAAGAGLNNRRVHVRRAFFAVPALGLALTACCLSSGCTSFTEVTDLKEIQDTAGFYPKALYYCGSDETCHFFEQETPLADLTILSKDIRTIMVSRQEVSLPGGSEFPRQSCTGRSDTRRQLMRIRITGRHPNRGLAECASPDSAN